MKEYDSWDYDDAETRSVRGSNFNKEKFCKRNKIRGGLFGPHEYNASKRCIRCDKIDPSIKHNDKLEE